NVTYSASAEDIAVQFCSRSAFSSIKASGMISV
ncbi:hypothetical protein Tco_0479745, partial [Tanacetum coccineum]